MISYLFALLRTLRVAAVEITGSVIAIHGIAQFSHRAAWIAGGCVVLLKSMEMDLKRSKDSKP